MCYKNFSNQEITYRDTGLIEMTMITLSTVMSLHSPDTIKLDTTLQLSLEEDQLGDHQQLLQQDQVLLRETMLLNKLNPPI